MSDIYHRLADHLADLTMGYPFSEALLDLLRETFQPDEAAVLLGLPTDLRPLEVVSADEVAANLGRTVGDVEPLLERAASRNAIFSGPTPDGKRGYALLQVGYGMPQTFFWHGRMDDQAKKMGRLVYKYFRTEMTREIYAGTPTKSYRYVPVELDVETGPQEVAPFERMEAIIAGTGKIGLAHCPCRVAARAGGRTDCNHSLEVCFKYDDLAEFVIHQGLARPVSKDEALGIMLACEEEGLVHMVDNTRGPARHTCNCCGHYCWNVGLINRRRVPRDVLMAAYFIRSTELSECISCGACAEICPVSAVEMGAEGSVVDMDWCIGCGVCIKVCPTQAISIRRRTDKQPPEDADVLHDRIRAERFGG